MLLGRVNKWFSRFKDRFFIYKDGFFELPYLANSPETVIQSIDRMPFIKHNRERQLIISKTPLVSGHFYYEKIEEGLWIIQGDFTYKANVSYKRVSDHTLPSDYYFLTLKVYGLKQKKALLNGIAYTNSSWLLFKPDAWSTNCQFKGARELTFTIFFNESWLKNILYKKEHFINSTIREFFESDIQYIIWPDNPENIEDLYQAIYDNFEKNLNRTDSEKGQLKDLVYQMFIRFIDRYKTDGINTSILEVPDGERRAIYSVEKILLQNLTDPFPGIERLAKEVGISPTRLKSHFKLMFGTSIFQYFRQKQMEYARHLLQTTESSIKDIAMQLGYENATKFSAAFREHMGVLPSQVVVGSK